MIDGLKSYAEMKPSGFAWLGDVPAHWDILRAKRLLRPTQLPVRPDDEIVTCFRDGQVTLRKNRRAGGFMIALLEQGYQGVRVGQLVVHSMDAFAGAIGVSDSNGKCTPEYIVCEPRSEATIPGYYSWVLRLAARTGYILASCPAVRERAPRLRYPDLAELRVPVPPPDEQRLIVRFLDWHGAQTAKLIRAKKKIIALLNEQKQAIIHRAVTRGLDPNVRMKSSGFSWIGEIPAHWDLAPNRAFLQKRKLIVGEAHIKYDLLSLTKNGVILRNVESGKGKFSSDMGTSQRVDAGDLVFCLFDIPETPRTVGLSRHNGMITGAYTVFSVKGAVNPEFIELFYISMDDKKLLGSLYSGLRNTIAPSRFLGIKTPIPPMSEQRAIVEAIKSETAGIDANILLVQGEVSLIQEFRTRLIADVVTGKLDVRTLAATLPEVADDQPIEGAVEEDDLYGDEAGVEDQEEVAA